VLFGAAELITLTVWALVVMQPYLDLNPAVYPGGGEAINSLQSHYVWIRARECGWCALWNGSAEGGNPAHADPIGHVMNPFVIVTTLIWGIANGTKLLGVCAAIILGLAQWWMARVL